MARDVTIGVELPTNRTGRSRAKGADDVPTRKEVVAILHATPDRWKAAIALGMCGLRISEVLGVCVDQLDMPYLDVDRQLQLIDREYVLNLPKRAKTRRIRVHDVADWCVRGHVHRYGPFEPLGDSGRCLLFRGSRGGPVRRDLFVDQVWKPALVAVGIAPDRYTFHSLRHWAASTMLSAGATTVQVAGYLGDTSETVERTYFHFMRDEIDVPAAVLSRMLQPTSAMQYRPDSAG